MRLSLPLWRSAMLLVWIAVILASVACIFVISTDGLAQFGARPSGARRARILASPNYDGRHFRNPVETKLGLEGSWFEMISHWMFGKEDRVPKHQIPIVGQTGDSFDTGPPAGFSVTWLGHATVLMEIDGKRLLTDPVWSKRCSPSGLMGPKRFHAPPISLDDLPPLDAVIISHDHYDHLDKDSVISLARTGVPFLMPLGVGSHLEKWGVPSTQIVELDWWESWEIDSSDFRIVATPARHFSGRGVSYSVHTFWASWTIIGAEHRLFFSGDSGMFPGFAEIGERYGPFDVTLMKIGAYGEGWPAIHLNPEEAAEAHVSLGGSVLVPVHWGTFNLAYHNWYDPPDRLLEAAKDLGIKLLIPRPGQILEIANPLETVRWWASDTNQ